MALKTGPEVLPNLKIQVENELLEEAMDVDEDGNEEKKNQVVGIEDSDLEEGELSDSKEDDLPASRHSDISRHFLPEFERRYENKSGAFVTGVDIFSKDGQEMLDVRAKRFGLDPSQVKPVNELQLQQLYESLGVTEEESSSEKQGCRLDALHIRGTEDMSTQDVFDYFKDYGPASIEWINDVCCNVVWLDKTSPARALLGLSRPISGLTLAGVRRDLEEVVLVEEDDDDPEQDEEDMPEADLTPVVPTETPMLAVSIEPQLQPEAAAEKVEVEKAKVGGDAAVQASEIEAPIPPGLWRLGIPYAKSRCILLRFCTRADRKPKQAEKLSDYYKKYGNPNYGGIRGIISSSRKRRYHSDKHRRPEPDEVDEDEDPSGKNPWGSLAQNWGTMDRSHTRPGFFDQDDPLLLDRPAELRTILRSGRSNPPPPPPTLHSSGSDSDQGSVDSEEDSRWRKRLKGPHMRMYADDEEAKVQKRRKLNARLGKRPSPPPRSRDVDLRAKLSRAARPKVTRGSVWTRLEAAKTKREVELAAPSGEEWSTEDDEQEEEEEDAIVTTVRSQISDLRDALASKKKSDGGGDDLRSKLNKKKKKKDKSVTPPPSPPASATPPYEKSPLRIEISNDEYCGGSTGSGSGSDSGSGSGSGSGSSSSGEESS